MENYTKYRLKGFEELEPVIKETDNIFVIACNKCFKEFEALQEPDCDAFRNMAAYCGKNVTGAAKIDFLCNKVQTERKLMDAIPEGTENIFVLSCGLGVQTIADMAEVPARHAPRTSNLRRHPHHVPRGNLRNVHARGSRGHGRRKSETEEG